MPTILRVGPYKFYFYSHEPNEPAHVHVDKDHYSTKIWLEPVAVALNYGFSAKELGKIIKIVNNHHQHLLDSWNGYFSN